MDCADIPWAFEKAGTISTGLWSLGRSSGIPEGMSKMVYAPDYFLNSLPKDIPIHGEVWYNDRLDMVKETVGTKNRIRPTWALMKFLAFNIKPYNLFKGIHKFNFNTEFAEPMEFGDVLTVFQTLTPNEYFQPIDFYFVSSESDFEAMTENAVKLGWEGMMLADPRGSYELKRSYNTLKWKSVFETEAEVIGYEAGKTGKCVGQVGALKVKLTWDDKVLSVFGGLKHHVNKTVYFNLSGLYDDDRSYAVCEQTYPIGSMVKLSYYGVSFDGIPSSANIYRGM
jgi:hypothetical protein